MTAPELDELGPITPADMVSWLKQELRDLSRATQLRTQDAVDFVTAFATGRISEKEVTERLSVYGSRWGDAIPGLMTTENMTNEEIIRRLDGSVSGTSKERVWSKLAERKEERER